MQFSVLIPVYNVEKYLHTCVQSVLQQTEQDFEIILVDDGSTDASGNICDAYMAQYPQKVQVFHQKNQGQMKSRLQALSLAQGEYVLYLDSDDFWDKDLLQCVASAIYNTKADLVIFCANVIDSEGNNAQKLQPFPNIQKTETVSKELIYKTTLTSWDMNAIWLKCVKKELLIKSGMQSAVPSILQGEDLLQILPILSNAKTPVYLPFLLYNYRLTQSGISRKYKKTYYEDMKFVFSVMEGYMEAWGMMDISGCFFAHTLQVPADCILMMKWADCPFSRKEQMHYLKKIAADSWFRNAYQKANQKNDWKVSILYFKCFGVLQLYYFYRDVKDALENKFLFRKKANE